MKKKKTEKIDIFKSAKIMEPPTEEEAQNKAFYAIEVYLDIIKDDEEKINDFSDLVNDLIRDARIKQKTNNKFDI